MRRRTLMQTAAGLAVFSSPLFARLVRAQDKTILRMGFADEVLTLDPIKTVYGPDILIQGIMFSRLLRASADRKELFPALAESYEISPDGKTYTFKLADAKFSDGSPITAEDVAFSYTRMRFQKDSAYAGPFTALEKVEAADPKTVVMHLNKTFTPFIQNVEMWNSGIVPKAAVEALGDEKFAQAPVSSGPFRLVEWRKGDRVILEKNPNYYRDGLPKIDGIEIIYVPDDNTRVSMLRAGEVDMIMGAPYPLIQALGAEGFQATPEPSSVITLMLINHSAEPFNDILVRQAVSAAIDRKAITDAVTLGMAQPASSLMAPVLNYFNTDLPVPVRDVAKAKELLAKAGKPTVAFDLMISAGLAADERTAVLIQSQLAEAGITANITKVDSTQAWNSLVDGSYQATLNWWYNETPDPDVALRWAIWGAGDNKSYYTRYNNDRVNEILEQAAATPEGDARKALYFEAQKLAYEEVAQIGLFYPPARNVYSAKVKGMRLNPGYQFSTIDEVTLES
ncbi:MAG: ABC transporter substrate-binding protein [Rhizobiales bacterium]|nr:ABC transporter substrate-binding protein [Hyphomicrobiales bacterium]